jgi:hypothetical protein
LIGTCYHGADLAYPARPSLPYRASNPHQKLRQSRCRIHEPLFRLATCPTQGRPFCGLGSRLREAT